MKTIIVACGGGIATSTVIVDEIMGIARDHKIKINVIQCTLSEMSNYYGEADLLVTSTPLGSQTLPIPHITGTSFITGMGMEETKRKILEVLKK